MLQIKPVACYEHLLETNETLIKNNRKLKSIILINCGGNVDLNKVGAVVECTFAQTSVPTRP
jgi:hypothetical protein